MKLPQRARFDVPFDFAASICGMEKLMIREQTTISKEVSDVQYARWEGFRILARKLPNHHILAVELIRTLKDETVAVFTVVRNGEPVKYMVTGDSRGRVKSHGCDPQQPSTTQHIAHTLEAAVAPPPVDPSIVATGNPPPTEPITPGVLAVGEALLSVAFNTGEQVNA